MTEVVDVGSNRWVKVKRPYIRQRSGRKFFLAEFKTAQWNLQDIAYHLAGINRYTGGSRYSVAQHCVVAARMAARHYPYETNLPARMLIHDVAESAYGDMSSPLKSLCPDYNRLLTLADASVEKFFDLTFMDDPLVKEVDTRMWLTESETVYWDVEEDTSEDVAWCALKPFPLPDTDFEAWDPDEAEGEWLLACRTLLPWAWK